MILVETSGTPARETASDVSLKDAQTKSLCYERECLIREPLAVLKLSKL